MSDYREAFYSNYFTNQAGREHTAKRKEKFDLEKYQFKKEIVPLLPVDQSIKILDIGCGTGSLLGACKDAGYKNVAGIDLSDEMVAVAHDFDVPEAVHGDLNAYLKDKDGQYDVISGMDIIEHFTKDELTILISTLKKALKPGGKVIFRTPNLDAPFGNIYANGDFTHENYLNKNSATQLMMAMGFKNVAVLPAHLEVSGALKEVFRKFIWNMLLLRYRIELFASARSAKKIVFTPNMLISAGL